MAAMEKIFDIWDNSLTSSFLSLLRTVAIASIEWENP